MDDQCEKSDERPFADDILFGAEKIAAFIDALVGADVDVADVYYFRKSGKWPIGKLGKHLVASKAGLIRHARKAVSDVRLPAS